MQGTKVCFVDNSSLLSDTLSSSSSESLALETGIKYSSDSLQSCSLDTNCFNARLMSFLDQWPSVDDFMCLRISFLFTLDTPDLEMCSKIVSSKLFILSIKPKAHKVWWWMCEERRVRGRVVGAKNPPPKGRDFQLLLIIARSPSADDDDSHQHPSHILLFAVGDRRVE